MRVKTPRSVKMLVAIAEEVFHLVSRVRTTIPIVFSDEFADAVAHEREKGDDHSE